MSTEAYLVIAKAISTAEYETGMETFRSKDAHEREVLNAAAELIEQAGKMVRQLMRETMQNKEA